MFYIKQFPLNKPETPHLNSLHFFGPPAPCWHDVPGAGRMKRKMPAGVPAFHINGPPATCWQSSSFPAPQRGAGVPTLKFLMLDIDAQKTVKLREGISGIGI
jgi:hypothetical protein